MLRSQTSRLLTRKSWRLYWTSWGGNLCWYPHYFVERPHCSKKSRSKIWNTRDTRHHHEAEYCQHTCRHSVPPGWRSHWPGDTPAAGCSSWRHSECPPHVGHVTHVSPSRAQWGTCRSGPGTGGQWPLGYSCHCWYCYYTWSTWSLEIRTHVKSILV